MRCRFYLPEEVRFTGQAEGVDRVAVEAAIRAGIARAIAGAAGGEASAGEAVASGGEGSPQALREPFDPGRHSAERRGYRVPSYDDGGEPVELPLAEGPTDRLFDDPGPLEGRLLAIFPRWTEIRVRSERYAVLPNLARAIAWGNLLFGGRSFAVLEGADGFWAVATGEAVSTEDLRLKPAGEVAGTPLVGAGGTTVWFDPVRDANEESYRLRTLVTVEGDPLFPPDPSEIERFLGELSATPAREARIDRGLARGVVFADVDRLLAGEETAAAADRLAELDASAFALVPWEYKTLYLEALLASWTGEAEEKAIIEIFKSLGSRSELDAALALLREAGRFDRLFDDLDTEVWSLLAVVGERFGDPAPMTFERLVDLLLAAEVLPSSFGELVEKVVLAPGGPMLSLDVLAELEEAAHSVVRFAGATGESLWMFLSRPDRVVEGVAQLVRLLGAVLLARAGHAPSRRLIDDLLERVGRQVLRALAGAEVLGVGEYLVRRARWALVWEVASMFIGVGEVRAAIAGAGVGEKAIALVRLLRLMRSVIGVGDAAALEGKLARLAVAIARATPELGASDEVLKLLSYLPQDDLSRLGRVLERVEIADGADLARLSAGAPDLARELADLLPRARALSAFAERIGGLGDEAAEAFARLLAHRLSPRRIEHIAEALPPGAEGRFLQVLARLDPVLLARGGRTSGELVELLAPSARRMEAVVEDGPLLVSALHRRSGGSGATLDGYLESLRALREALPVESRAAEYRRLLDRLELDDAGAWVRLESERRLRAGEPILTGLAEAIADRLPAQQGFQRLLRGRHDALLDEIADDVLPNDPKLAGELLAKIGALDDTGARGLAHLHEMSPDLSGAVGWSDVFGLPAADRGELLGLVARLRPAVEQPAGLARAVSRILTGPGSNVQGTLGHLWAARTLQRRFPAARFELEVQRSGREVDVLVKTGGRSIEVEVKTGLGATPPIEPAQIRGDLLRHLDDRFEDLLYLYEPGQTGALGQVRDGFRKALAHPDVQTALARRGIAPADATRWLEDRLAGDLVSTFAYAE